MQNVSKCTFFFSNQMILLRTTTYLRKSRANADCRYRQEFGKRKIIRYEYRKPAMQDRYKNRVEKEFFQILWKSWCNILVSFQSHLRKLCSIPRF